MSVIGYREWQIWTNLDFFENETDVQGIATFKITPSLMAEQSINFIYEKLERIRQGTPQFENIRLQKYFNPACISPTNELVIQKCTSIQSNVDSLKPFIYESLEELEALSLCLDFPLTCNEIRFIVPPGRVNHGDVFIASRKPIGRGMAFEVEERGVSSSRLTNDFTKFINLNSIQKVAVKHYLNGLTILGLEDQFSGLIDAAFMQFYQACEVLCGENFKLKEVKKFIAGKYPDDSKKLQIIAHHVWQVRHNYFGHGNVDNNISNIGNIDDTFNAAKQVLIVRWLCKYLLDLDTESNPLSREMRLYHKSHSVYFSGSIELLKSEFYTGYDFTNIQILDSNGNTLESFDIQV